MTSLSAESYFKKGLSALVDQKYADASALFRRALDLDRDRNRRQPDMRYLSYYGFSLAKAKLSSTLAIQACRTAASRQRKDPVLFLNLGRVYVMANKISLAAEAFETGLRLAPGDRLLAAELAGIDRRSRPVVPLLSRDHALNRWLGRVRHSRRARNSTRPFLIGARRF